LSALTPSFQKEIAEFGSSALSFVPGRDPFAAAPDEAFFFSNALIRNVYGELIAALRERPGFALLTGEPGVGKTVLLQRLCGELKASGHLVITRYRPGLDLDELVRIVAEEMRLGEGDTEGGAQRLRRLRDALERGDGTSRPVLVIDDAEKLGGNVVTSLVHLLGGPPERSLRVLLSGRLQLATRLNLPVFAELRRLRSAGCRLDRFDDDDAASYICHRLRRARHLSGTMFSAAAIDAVIAQSAGLPRRINQLCARSLMMAADAGGGRAVTAEIVERAAAECSPKGIAPREAGRSPTVSRGQHAVIAVSLCATLVAGGMALHVVRARDQARDVAGLASAAASASSFSGGSASADRPAAAVSSGDAALGDRPSSPPRPAQAAVRIETRPASSSVAPFVAGIPVAPTEFCREAAGSGSATKCDAAAASADAALGDILTGGKADGAMPPSDARLRVAAAMSLAQSQLEEGHIVTPAGDNALESYRRLAAADRDAPEARRLLQQVRLGLRTGARNALVAGNAGEAERLYALAVHPEGDIEDGETAMLGQAVDPAGISGDVSEGGAEAEGAVAEVVVPGNAISTPAGSDNISIEAQPVAPSAMDEAPRFAIGEGSRTIGADVPPSDVEAATDTAPPTNTTPNERGEAAAVSAAGQASEEEPAKSAGSPLETRPVESSTPPAVSSAPPAQRMAPDLVDALVKRGDELMRIGDISGARLAYEHAASAGSAKAMSGLGMTYDPNFLSRVNARGIQPDAARAAEWYRKAAGLGDAEASRRVLQLPAPVR
jgi:type II secretory pathway predicted ATPase ExeA